MNTPYPELARRIDIAALNDWNIRNERSRREYGAAPFAACLAPECDELGAIEAGFCVKCAIEHRLCIQCQQRTPEDSRARCYACRKGGNQSAAERMRLRRARTRASFWAREADGAKP